MLPVNTPIWIPDSQNGFVEGLVVEEFTPGQPARVQLVRSHTEAVLPPAVSKLVERRVDEENSPNDLSSLVHLSRASLLEALRLRHEQSLVYTSVGPILVSVNPYKMVSGLYSEEKKQQYFDLENKDPHVYETASRAFLGATINKQDQSVIFSGESGAGKTFATKLFRDFLVYASSRSENRSEERARIQERLQSALPMIEAFGNAKTSRNDNSSRFGCWTEIEFSGNEICGASVTGFNLEKSRVVNAVRGTEQHQRNFHIFYQVCASNPALMKGSFAYLSGSEWCTEDKEQFQATLKAMEDIQIDATKVLDLVEGILFLGNVEFRAVEDKVTGEETSEVANREVLEKVCDLLGGLDVDELAEALVIRDMSNPREQILKPHTKAQAEEARDALAKHCYGRLFDWLLVRVNDATSSKKRNGGFNSAGGGQNQQGIIGLLDTYGFEIFATNSFEQLCINYCNERIMSAFNDTCIKAEHDLYQAEGLKILGNESGAEVFLDRSKVCLDLLEATPGGVFSLLDDEIRIPKGSDLQYLRKLRDAQKGHSNFIPYISGLKDTKAKHLFGVVHFAGTVHYCVEDFLEKNRDTLHATLDRICCGSQGFLGRDLFAPELFSLSSSPKKTPNKRKSMKQNQHPPSSAGKATTASQKQSLGFRFRAQLNELMGKISQTQTHFVRCIKPNERSVSQFQGSVVLEQLNYGGVLETCRLRKDGFQVRRSHSDFLATYGKLLNRKGPVSAEELARELEQRFGVACQIGKTTAFLKAEDFNKLEKAMVDQENDARVTIQAFGRLVLERQKHSKRKLVLDELSHATKSLNEQRIANLLEIKVKECFPKGSNHLPQIKKAKQILQFLAEERAVCKEIQEALATKNETLEKRIVTLDAAVTKAKAMNHDLEGKVAKVTVEAEQVLKAWKDEDAKAKQIKRENDREAKSASALRTIQRVVKRFLYAKRVRDAFKQLKEGMATKNMDQCMRAVRRLSDLGLRDHPLVMEAAKMLPERKKKPTKQLDRALQELGEAMNVARFKTQRIKTLKPEDVAALTYAINKARVEGCTEDDVQDAIELEREMLTAVASNKGKKWWMCCGACTGGGQNVIAIPNASDDPLLTAKPKRYV